MAGIIVLYCSISSCVMTWRPKRRMERQGPSSASGGMMALTREPSGQAGVDDGLRFVDAAADLRDDLLDDVQQVRVVLEAHLGFGELAVALDVDLVEAVDEDIGDGGLLEQRLERAQAEHFVEHLLDDLVLLGGGHGDALVFEQALDHAADLGAHAVLRDGGDAVEVQHADELAVDLRFQLEIAVGGAGGHGRSGTALGRPEVG